MPLLFLGKCPQGSVGHLTTTHRHATSPHRMVTITELEQRISDNRREGRRLLSIEETLAVIALLKVLLPRADIEAQPVLEAVQDFARLP